NDALGEFVGLAAGALAAHLHAAAGIHGLLLRLRASRLAVVVLFDLLFEIVGRRVDEGLERGKRRPTVLLLLLFRWLFFRLLLGLLLGRLLRLLDLGLRQHRLLLRLRGGGSRRLLRTLAPLLGFGVLVGVRHALAACRGERLGR